MRGYRSYVARPALYLCIASLAAACADSGGPTDPGPPASADVDRIEIQPGALLLVNSGDAQTLRAIAYDASGNEVEAEVAWQSSAPGVVAVSPAGVASAAAASGSAEITASADGVVSKPVLAIVATPAPGVVLIPDSLILTNPTEVDASAPYEPGWRYTIDMRGPAPAGGSLVLGTGGRPLAGRILSSTPSGGDVKLTVELVALDQLFSDLRFNARIPLEDVEDGAGANWRLGARGALDGAGASETEFELGRFKCKSSTTTPSLDLPTPSLDVTPSLSLLLDVENGLRTYAVIGRIGASFAYKPKFTAVFGGEVGCETVLRTLTLPITGWLSLFFGVQVPVGVGFDLSGKLEIAEVGMDVTASASAEAELGLQCPVAGGECTGLTGFETQRDFDFKFTAPDPTEQFKVEIGANGFLFAKPAFGSVFSSSTQFEFVAAKAGVKQTMDLATTLKQARDADYASGFRLGGTIKVGPGSDLNSMLEKLGRLLNRDLTSGLTLIDEDVTIAESPRGTLTIAPASVEPGETATFVVELDPITYVGLDAVDAIEIMWKKDGGTGSFTLDPGRPGCTVLTGVSGRTRYECEVDFLEEHRGVQTFYAFVHARMFGVPVPIALEIASDGQASVAVGVDAEVTCPAPPDWAEASIVDDSRLPSSGSWSSSLTPDYAMSFGSISSTLTSGTLGPDVQASVRIRDYVAVIPEDPTFTGRVRLVLHVTGDASASKGGNVGRASFYLSHPLGPGIGAEPPPSEAPPSASNTIDEVLTYSRTWNTGEWEQAFGDITGRVRVEAVPVGTTASASGSLSVSFLGAVDELGNPVPVKLCSASGTAY